MPEEKELRQKLIAYRVLEARLQGLIKQRELIANKILEINSTLESIKEIEKNHKYILFPLGSEAYVFGELKEKNKLLVEIGANVALEKNFEEGKNILEKRKAELEKALQEIQKELIVINASMENLAEEIEKITRKEQ
ncbi:MAG: prefoldin subunit alpha [Candidatus Aenigmatarchaeota archaeon]